MTLLYLKVMPLRVKLDVHEWVSLDYTDVDALGITGTIYSDDILETAFDLTGYTLTLRLKSQGRIVFDSDITDRLVIVTAASGTFRFTPANGDLVSEHNGEVSIVLEKTDTQITATGINSSADLYVQKA